MMVDRLPNYTPDGK